MEIKKPILFLATICIFFSCEKNNELKDLDNLLIGHWSNTIYEDEKITFERVTNLLDEAYGISFKNEGIYIERSSGFCGTPPLTFFNIEGTWQTPENSLVEVNLQNFHGNFKWRIICLTEEKLVVKRELSEQEKEHRNLMALFDEISTLSYSVSCSNASDWNFIQYGSKSCGGPQGYIVYSNQIDVTSFLQLVLDYTEAEHQYNIKWGILSTCNVLPQPVSIECQNGLPVLIY